MTIPLVTSPARVKVVEPAKPLRSDAARNRNRLLTAGIELLAEVGLDVPVECIARAAGVGIGTLYRHFPSKEDLLTAIADDLVDHVLRLADTADLIEPAGAGFERFLFDVCALQSRYGRVLGTLWTREPATSRMNDEVAPRLLTLLVGAQQAGLIRADAAESDAALLIWSVAGIVENTREFMPDAWRRMFGLAMRGLRSGAPLNYPPMTADQLATVRADRRQRLVTGAMSEV